MRITIIFSRLKLRRQQRVEEPVVKEYELDGAKLETAAAGKFTDGQTVAKQEQIMHLHFT